MKRERDPTPEEFEKLLAWLDPDPNVAAVKYTSMHDRLVKIFVFRCCVDAETLADEVINRVAVRVDNVVKTYPGDPARCFQGFAENVSQEARRDQRRLSNVEPPVQPTPPDNDQLEQEDECLARCLADLSPADSDLFSRYFQEDNPTRIEARKKLAGELGLTANALRIKAYRIRKRLNPCMAACLEEFSKD